MTEQSPRTRNLSLRLRAPAQGNGRLQRAVQACAVGCGPWQGHLRGYFLSMCLRWPAISRPARYVRAQIRGLARSEGVGRFAAHSKIKRPPTETASKPAKKNLGYCGIPSTMNERACVVLSLIALTSFMYDELLKACAFSTLSNAYAMKRSGAVPSRAVILLVRAM